jgi:endonuclease-3
MRPFSKRAAGELYRRLAAARPIPQTELEFASPFTLLVAVVLSAQATDAGVNKATPALFALADTPQRMLALGEDRVAELIRTIGLYRTKAKNLVALSRIMVERHDGEVPRDRALLEALPGVGRKTANVVLNVAFGEPTIAVDTHIFRVANRTGLAPGKTPIAVEAGLQACTPAQYRRYAHHWLILHGRYVCQAKKPLCPECVIADLCRYPAKTGPAPSLPSPARGGGKGGGEDRGAADAAPPPARRATGPRLSSLPRAPVRRRR